jgi:hypothetical protein
MKPSRAGPVCKLPHFAVFPEAQLAYFAEIESGIESLAHAGGGKNRGSESELPRLLKRGV